MSGLAAMIAAGSPGIAPASNVSDGSAGASGARPMTVFSAASAAARRPRAAS